MGLSTGQARSSLHLTRTDLEFSLDWPVWVLSGFKLYRSVLGFVAGAEIWLDLMRSISMDLRM